MADRLIRRVSKNRSTDLRVARGEFHEREFIAISEWWLDKAADRWKPKSGRQVTFPPSVEIARQLALGILHAVGDEEGVSALEPFRPDAGSDPQSEATRLAPACV